MSFAASGDIPLPGASHRRAGWTVLTSSRPERVSRSVRFCKPIDEVITVGRDHVLVLHLVWVRHQLLAAVPHQAILFEHAQCSPHRSLEAGIGVNDAPLIPLPNCLGIVSGV